MKRTLLFTFLSLIIIQNIFAWDYIPGNGILVDNFAENEDGTRRIIATGGGFWLSNDSGQNWMPINDRVFPPNASIFNPANVYELYMLDAPGDTIITRYYCGQGPLWVYSISEDGGENWRVMMPPSWMTSASQQYAFIDPHDHSKIDYYVYDKIYTSYDFGRTWSDSIFTDHTLSTEQDMVRHHNTLDTLYICGDGYSQEELNGSISYSYDGGNTWHGSVNSNAMFGRPGLRVAELTALSNGDILGKPQWAFNDDFNSDITLGNGLLRSSDYGQTWQYEVTEGETISLLSPELPGFPGHILLKHSSYNSILLSTDYGHTFSTVQLDSLVSIRSLSVNNLNNSVYLNSFFNGVYKSTDGGLTWELYQTIDTIGKHTTFHVNESSLTTIGNNYRSIQLNFESGEWENFFYGDFTISPNTYVSNYPPVQIENGPSLVSATVTPYVSNDKRFFLMKKDCESDDWSVRPYPIDNNLSYLYTSNLSHYFDENFSRLIISEYNDEDYSNTFHVSLDTGATWTSYDPPFDIYNPKNISQWRDEIYLPANGQLYKSTDNCSTWVDTDLPLSPDYHYSGILVDDPEDESIYTFFNTRCYKYSDNEWEQRGEIRYVIYAALVPTDADPVLVINRQYKQLFISPDGGHTWNRIDEGMPLRRQIRSFQQIEYDKYRNRIWVSTSIGLMYADIENLLSVEKPGTAFVPVEAKPISVYPNPFNASINISYKVVKTGPVELKLFNITGQEVATLVDEVRRTGYQELSFDASSLASGIYFLKFNDGVNVHTRKITLVK